MELEMLAPNKENISLMLDELEQEDYLAAIDFIGYLASLRRKKKAAESKKIMRDIQAMFKDDKGWESEEEMLADMAKFRRERLNL